MDFNTLVKDVLRREGGSKMTEDPADRGGRTKFGISQAAHPDVDVASLDEGGAIDIYRQRFWGPLGADSLPPQVRALAFDTAVHHGVGRTKKWLEASGGDPAKLLGIRKAALQQQAASDPSQQKFLKGWMNRLAEFGDAAVPDQLAVANIERERPSVGRLVDAALSAQEVRATRDMDELDQQIAAETAQAEAAKDVGFVDALGTAFKDPRANAIVNILGRIVDKPAEDPKFNYYDHPDRAKWEAGLKDNTQLQFLRENNGSLGEVEWALKRLEDDAKRDEVYQQAGTGNALAANLVVGVTDPVGWALGLGAGKVAQIAGTAYRLGKGARAGVALGEGVAGNVLWEAVQDGMGEVKTLEDYGMAAAFGAAFTAPFIPLAVRGDHVGAVDDALRRAADENIQAAAQARADARNQGLTPDMEAEAQARVIAQETAPLRTATPDHETTIIPQDLRDPADDLLIQETPPPAPLKPAATPQPQAPGAPSAPAPVQLRLPKELSGAKPRFKEATVEFGSDVDKALYIVAASGKLSKKDAAYMTWLRGQFPDASDADIRAQGALVRARVKGVDADNGVIKLPSEEALQGPAAGYSPAVRKEGEGVSLREALTGAAKSSAVATSGMFRETFAYLKRAIPANILDTVVTNHELGRGKYDQLKRKLYTPMPAGAENVTRLEAQTMAHEAVHAATAHIIQAVREGARGVTQAQKQAVQRLDELRVQLRKLAKEQGVDLSRNTQGVGYALNSPIHELDEFVAQVMSDPETRTFMAAQPGRGYQADTMLEAFYRAIMTALGFNPKTVRPDTALFDAMVQIDTLIRTGGDFGGTDVMFGPSPQTRAITDQNFADRMYGHAKEWLQRHPVDMTKLEAFAQQVTAKGSMMRDYLVSDGLKMAASKNPIMQMLSGLLVETTTGATGRHTNAGVHKHMLGLRIVGRSLNDYDTAYANYRKRNGGGHVEDMMDGEVLRKFDREVYEEVLRRRYGQVQPVDGAVREAADAIERMMQRSLDVQKESGTLGSGLLPEDSVGYLPQQQNPDALAAATAKELEEFAEYLTGHWKGVYGWSNEFSKVFSRFYINRARERATKASGGVDFVALESPTSAVRDTLEQMRLDSRSLDVRVAAELERVGAMPSNKRRLDVNPLATLPSGKKVLDYYVTSTRQLARAHANTVAGHSALAARGILGKRGVNNLLKAIDNAPENERATPDEVSALQRTASELLGVPYEGERRSELAAGLGALVRLQRLGGLVFTQFAESVQLVLHLGLSTGLKAMGSLPRQVLDTRRLVDGKQTANQWLASIEQHQGFEVGMEGFRMVSRLDPPDELLREYGKGSSLATRLLSAGNHFQAIVSLFRGLHAAQHRATAEHIMKRAIGYIQDGNVDTDRYLQDMGISPALARAIKSDLPRALIKDAEGRTIGFDIGGLSTQKAKDQLIAAVHRGTSQIIQGTFIGERGKWASDDWAKVLLQLRTFSLTAMEKQWARTRMLNSNGPMNGYGYAAGVLIGQMAFGSMIYAARAHLYAVNREDREEYLERAFSPASLLQASLNYSAMSGLSGDALDLISSTAGGWDDDMREALGTRSFATGIGGLIPAAGSIDAAFRVAQGKADVHTALKQLPLSNLPWLVPILNAAKED